jgi:hypothetical protein
MYCRPVAIKKLALKLIFAGAPSAGVVLKRVLNRLPKMLVRRGEECRGDPAEAMLLN